MEPMQIILKGNIIGMEELSVSNIASDGTSAICKCKCYMY